MPGASSAEPSGRYCSVRAAAARLNCSEQSVRNLIRSRRLRAERGQSGKRTDVYRVIVTSVDEYLEVHGTFPTRTRRTSTAAADRIKELENRVRLLENRVSNGSAGDPVNLRFANLRLLEIQEEYGKALAALQKITANYRDVVEQFHLPVTPPIDP
jgi:helix-turn-helix protein